MSRIKIIGIIILTLAVITPEAAHADWKVYYTGQAAGMFGSGGRGSFATRSQCEAARNSRPAFERNNSYCSGYDTPSYTPPAPNRPTPAPSPSIGDGGAAARDQEEQRQLQLQREKKFAEDKEQLLETLKGAAGSSTLNLKSGDSTALPLKSGSPTAVSASTAWTPGQCQVAQRRVDAYRDALRQTVEVVERFNRTIAMDQGLRLEWENTADAAVERAEKRGQFLWLAVPLDELEDLNHVTAGLNEKEGEDLADLLAGTTDPRKRDLIRTVRQYLAEEKVVVKKLGESYANIDDALKLGGNAPLMLDDPDESPTSPFKGDGMKLREALDMLSGLLAKRASAPWAKYVAGGFSEAFKTEAAARAMFDSWYDALASGLAWKQLNNMNLNSDLYLQAVQKLGVEMRKRSDRLNMAKREFANECSNGLIAENANINAKDKYGNTPLHYAALRGQRKEVELLIAQGVDVNAKNNSGNTPLDIAVAAGKDEVAELLRKHGAR